METALLIALIALTAISLGFAAYTVTRLSALSSESVSMMGHTSAEALSMLRGLVLSSESAPQPAHTPIVEDDLVKQFEELRDPLDRVLPPTQMEHEMESRPETDRLIRDYLAGQEAREHEDVR